MNALFVASYYKNTPNDLQLMCDAPAGAPEVRVEVFRGMYCV